ncbi:MAG TPA: hypothetical protein VF212_11490 [Longimicrobiales bacterium]
MEWNRDPDWVEFIEKYEPVIRKIAAKYTWDIGLQEDCQQEARMALLTVFPERVTTNLDAYCRNVIRNSVLSYLTSYRTGDIYSGRTVWRGGEKVHDPPRYASLDQLVAFGMQVDEDGNISWISPSADGLLEWDDEGQTDTREGVVMAGSHGEDAILEAIDVERLHTQLAEWVDELPEADRKRGEAILAGRHGEHGETYERLIIRRVGHLLAVKAGVTRTCSRCGDTLQASHFGWNTDRCLDCESPSIRFNRNMYDRWLEAVENGEHWICENCGEKPALKFRHDTKVRCRACNNAKAQERGARNRPKKRACRTCDIMQPIEDLRGGVCSACREEKRQAKERAKQEREKAKTARIDPEPMKQGGEAWRREAQERRRKKQARREAKKFEAEKKEAPKKRRAREPNRLRKPAEHGTHSMYCRGCRCEACRKGHADYTKEYRRRRRARNAA